MISILAGWSGLLLIIFPLLGFPLFEIGDFNFYTAMAYHGIAITAWLLLLLAYLYYIKPSQKIEKWSGYGAVAAAILAGIGSMLIHNRGVSTGTVIQISGMVLTEIIALTIIILAIKFYFTEPMKNINSLAWWTGLTGLISMSLSAPLGHLAGATIDLGNKFFLILQHAKALNMPVQDVLDGYIGSHSHEILAAFFATAFTIPLISRSEEEKKGTVIIEKFSLFIIIIATIAQTLLYQYCAWSGWEPPTLFANGPNGIPLDDFILSILGIGLLILIYPLIVRAGKKLKSKTGLINITVALTLFAYLISIVALGIFIEFHEQYFGHGEGSARGVLHDMAYIRAHLLFGFMIIPILLGTLLHGELITDKKRLYPPFSIALLAIISGSMGVFTWTFSLNPLLVEVSFSLTALSLLVFGVAGG